MPDSDPTLLRDPARLAALRRTDLLDSVPDESFDRLTRLAARLLATPVALVTLVDEKRQFLKSAIGVSEPWVSRREMPIEYSYCRHTLASAEPLVIEDASRHPLTRNSPAVTENHALAYAGVPLTTDGHVLGTLCVVDTRCRQWTEEEIQSLRDLAASAQTELDLRRAEKQARAGHARSSATAAEAGANLAILEAVLRALPVGVLITDAEGKVQVTNPAAVRIWGGRTPMVGVDLYDEYRARWPNTGALLTPDEWPIARAIRSGQAILEEEIEIEAFDGERRTILASGLQIHDETGQVIGGVAVNADITARKEMEAALRESRGLFQTAFADAPIGMALVGLDGRWLAVNQALCSIVGYTEEELLCRTFQDITHPDDLEKDLAHAGRLVGGEIASYQMEKRYVDRDGRPVWSQLTGSLVRSDAGEPLYFIAQIQDISARMRVDDALRGYARELERSNRELQDFAYVASHDLQEPLRKIQAFGDRLHERYRDELGAQGADYLARMQSAARRMQALIQDLLAYSRVGSSAQPFAPVDLGQVAREVVSDLQAQVEATGGTVELGSLPTVLADPLQMRQLFQNLIGNALKFHREGVPPRVRLSGEVHETEGVRVRVEDNGIGFEAEYAERIFTVFERLHARTEYEGTGIGLAICRKIARRHGGEIEAHGVPGEGATFIVTIPVSRNQGMGAVR